MLMTPFDLAQSTHIDFARFQFSYLFENVSLTVEKGETQALMPDLYALMQFYQVAQQDNVNPKRTLLDRIFDTGGGICTTREILETTLFATRDARTIGTKLFYLGEKGYPFHYESVAPTPFWKWEWILSGTTPHADRIAVRKSALSCISDPFPPTQCVAWQLCVPSLCLISAASDVTQQTSPISVSQTLHLTLDYDSVISLKMKSSTL